MRIVDRAKARPYLNANFVIRRKSNGKISEFWEYETKRNFDNLCDSRLHHRGALPHSR